MPKDLITDVLPKALDDLALRINEAHTIALGSMRTSVELAIECGRLLNEAKELVAHGEWLPWLAANTAISRHTANCWMTYARNSELLLANVERMLHLTFAEADKLIAAQKGKKQPKAAASKKGRQQQQAQIQAALDGHDRLTASGKEPTQEAIKEEASVGVRAAGQAKAIRETEAKAKTAATAAAVEDATAKAAEAALSMTAQEKLDTALRARMRRLDAEVEERARALSKQRFEELSLPAYLQRLADIERMLSYPRKGVMTKSEYTKIVLCLHPDALNSRTQEQLAEGFRLFTHYKLKMVDDEEERRKLMSTLPRTVEEMLARKKKR